jgi:hypothetical protein
MRGCCSLASPMHTANARYPYRYTVEDNSTEPPTKHKVRFRKGNRKERNKKKKKGFMKNS